MRRQPLVLGRHARDQMIRRGLDEATVLRVALMPERVMNVRPGRETRLACVESPSGRETRACVVVELEGARDLVVTAWRTAA
jgi:hypothetical protein